MKIQSNNVKELGLIPAPSSIKKLDLNFPFTKTINIEFDNKDDSLKKIVTYFTNKFSKFCANLLKIKQTYIHLHKFKYVNILTYSFVKKSYKFKQFYANLYTRI